MKKKILMFGLLMTLAIAFVGCVPSTSSTTSTTAEETTAGYTLTTITATPLVNSIPDECSSIDIVDGWIPVWCDEFNYTGGVDTSKWSVVVGGGGFGNNELQFYTDRPENIYVANGNLTITALNDSYYDSNSHSTYQYTSAKIWTANTQNWKYGKFEMRAKIPYGRGTWPAFWMMPQDSRYGGWPDSGEIDIMEHVGYDMNNILGTIHTDRFNGSNGRGGSASILEDRGLVPTIDVVNTYHTYGVIWDETSITWYFDGLPYASEGYDPYLNGTTEYKTTVDWPFDKEFYVILNLAIGGNWGGAQGIDETIFPTSLIVDYVRVYQQDYITGDSENPSIPSYPSVLQKDDTSAYLTWRASTDDKKVAQYIVFVNGERYLSKLFYETPFVINPFTVNGVLIKGLIPNYDNLITVYAVDYVGHVSLPMQTIITT